MTPTTDTLAPLTREAMAELTARSRERGSGAAYQALLAATLEALSRLRAEVQQARDAALTLAQREHAGAVADGLATTAAALREDLAEGRACLDARPQTIPDALRGLLQPRRGALRDAAATVREALRPEEASPDWFSATAGAVGALGAAATHLDGLAGAQPDGSAARELARRVAAFLERSRDVLLSDVARLMD